MFYVIIRNELNSTHYDCIDFQLFRKFYTYEEALSYATITCNELSEYPMICGYEILETYKKDMPLALDITYLDTDDIIDFTPDEDLYGINGI